MNLLISLAIGVMIGTISGMIGLGGAIFLIPILVYGYGMDQKSAQGTSLATLLLPIGALAFWKYYSAGHVDLKLAALLAARFLCRRLFRRLPGAARNQRPTPAHFRRVSGRNSSEDVPAEVMSALFLTWRSCEAQRGGVRPKVITSVEAIAVDPGRGVGQTVSWPDAGFGETCAAAVSP